MNKLEVFLNIYQNMGAEYIYYRGIHEIKRKFGWLKGNYPTNPKKIKTIQLEDWKLNNASFFIQSKSDISVTKVKSIELKNTFDKLQKGILTYFSIEDINLGENYDWITNLNSGYTYDINKHWTDIEDINPKAGDIKYVWEKSRFSFLYTYIKYDYHFEEDCSTYVFKEIEDWIDKNPINQGPNYKCSQEISLRVLNWIFALHYYSKSTILDNRLFDKIMQSIYYQIDHSYKNINFSRKSVRNNHAISETLILYIVGTLFPQFPNAKKWKTKGKKWFEEEVLYQIYDDGTHLLFSTNYQRAVVMLFTWAVSISDQNKDKFSDAVYVKMKKSVNYLYQITNTSNGLVPNFGQNDGSMFYQLHNCNYRDFRPQLNTLYYYFNKKHLYEGTEIQEEANWFFNNDRNLRVPKMNLVKTDIATFTNGGYYSIKDEGSLTFIKCGAFKDRPTQSDNLHLDIWVNGINYLRDNGSYMYNTKNDTINYFNGAEGHNTVSIEGKNQMRKGNRFIWYNWVKNVIASLKLQNNQYIFNGEIEAFRELGNKIKHQRIITKVKGKLVWKIEDLLKNVTNKNSTQYWHINPKYKGRVIIKTTDADGNELTPKTEQKEYSCYYGNKEKSLRISFQTNTNKFNTTIEIIA